MDWYNNPDFSHGFLVAPFAAFLLWDKRKVLRNTPTQQTWSGIWLVVAAIFVLFLGVYGAELFLSRISLVMLLGGVVWTLFGRAVLREVRFAILVLLLAIPIPAVIFNQITFPLQLFASRMASAILPIFGVPVLRDGNVIQLPAMQLEVAEACSGIRSLMSLFAVAIFYGYFLERSTWRRVVLALAALPIAVFANAAQDRRHRPLRPVLEPRQGRRLLPRVLRLADVPRLADLPLYRAHPDASQIPTSKIPASRGQPMTSPRFWAVFLLLLAALTTLHLRESVDRVPPSEALSLLPQTIDNLTSQDVPITQDTLAVLGDGRFLNRLYTNPAPTGQLFTPPVSLFIGYFPTQRTGQSIHSPQNCLPGAGWTFASSQDHLPRAPRAQELRSRRVPHHQRLRQAGRPLLVPRSRPQHRQRLQSQGLHDARRHPLQPHRRSPRPPRHPAPAQRIRSHRSGPRHQVCRSPRTHAAPFHPQLARATHDPPKWRLDCSKVLTEVQAVRHRRPIARGNAPSL